MNILNKIQDFEKLDTNEQIFLINFYDIVKDLCKNGYHFLEFVAKARKKNIYLKI